MPESIEIYRRRLILQVRLSLNGGLEQEAGDVVLRTAGTRAEHRECPGT